MKKTLEELELLEYLSKVEKKRSELSIKLKICPICGSPIIHQNYEIFDKPKVYFFGLIIKKGYYWDYRETCSQNKEHFEIKRNYHSSKEC